MTALDIPHRLEAIKRTFANAFAALLEFRKLSPSDADHVAAAALATIRNAFPQALRADVESAPFPRVDLARPDPSPSAVAREIGAACWYEVAREGDRVRLYLHESTGHDACALLTPVQAIRLRADVDAVASAIGATP